MGQIKQIAIGLGISSTVYLGLGLIFTSGETRRDIILVLLFGAISGGLSLIYDNDKIPLLGRTLIHLIGMLITFYIIALSANWIEFNFVQILIATMIFLTIFFGIYTYFYNKEKREVEKINQKIND